MAESPLKPLPYARAATTRQPSIARICFSYLFFGIVVVLDVLFIWQSVLFLYGRSGSPNSARIDYLEIFLWMTILAIAIVICAATGRIIASPSALLLHASGRPRLRRQIPRVFLISAVGAILAWLSLGFVLGG